MLCDRLDPEEDPEEIMSGGWIERLAKIARSQKPETKRLPGRPSKR